VSWLCCVEIQRSDESLRQTEGGQLLFSEWVEQGVVCEMDNKARTSAAMFFEPGVVEGRRSFGVWL
jgi:hypothetical protein